MSGRKLASAAIEHRTQTPLFSWIRDKLLAVKRRPGTGTPGLPTPDGKAVFQHPGRFPDSQSARGGYHPQIPGGVHHLIAENYYYDRDGRNSVVPPVPLYEVKEDGSAEFNSVTGKKLEATQVVVNKGPRENFGLIAPTPGSGYEWQRSRDTEEDTQRYDPNLAHLERYDKFTVSKAQQ
uniref:NADH dehydrogenase [ubiquinone] 1 alpha subcomplex subunit 7 n=1 Tax=Acrobeloides nanus TaxID=290746 RepID=A0A914CU55_9BILA